MSKPTYSMVMTTVGTKRQAVSLADAIVRAGLAACVQSWPIHSTYRWKGKIESSAEILLLCKTRSGRVASLQLFIQGHHPYEVPEIVATSITGGSPSYLSWLRQETSCNPLTFAAPATRKRASGNGRTS